MRNLKWIILIKKGAEKKVFKKMNCQKILEEKQKEKMEKI